MPGSNVINQVSPGLLEAVLPGFGGLSRFLESKFGVDISALVSTCFMIVGLLGSYRYISRAVQNFVETWCVASITVTFQDRLYNQVLEYISRNILTESSRFLAANSRSSSWESRNQWEMRRATKPEDYDQDYEVNPAPMYVPAFGTHRFWHKGTFFIFMRSIQTVQLGNGGGSTEKESLQIKCYSRSPEPIKRLLRDCQIMAFERRRSMTTIHPSIGAGNWQRALVRPSRPIETVYMDEGVKNDLLSDVEDFLSPTQPRYYARRGIPYRRGYLFFGPPGTGKTSLSLALAGAFGLELYVISLMESGLTEQRLMSLFSSLPPRGIILIEDVDTAALSRGKLDKEQGSTETGSGENKDSQESSAETTKLRPKRFGNNTLLVSDPEKMSLSGLLNVIDGVASQEGRILIMTTNNPEALDEALIRPGRVDMQVHFGNLSKKNARLLFIRMYSEDTPQTDQNKTLLEHPAEEANGSATKSTDATEKLETYANQFYDAIPELRLTPAEVQGFLLTRRKSPQKAISEVKPWVDGVLAAKAQGKNIITTGDEVKPEKQL